MDDLLEAIFEGLFESIGDIFEDLLDGLFDGLLEGVGEFFEGPLEGFFEGAGIFFEGLFDGVGDLFEGFIEGVGGFFKGIFSNLFDGSDGSLENPIIDVAEVSENVFGSFTERLGDSLENIFKHSSSDSFADLIGALIDDSGRQYTEGRKEDYQVINEDYAVTSEYDSFFPVVEEKYESVSPTIDSREEFSVIKIFVLLFTLLFLITASIFLILSSTN